MLRLTLVRAWLRLILAGKHLKPFPDFVTVSLARGFSAMRVVDSAFLGGVVATGSATPSHTRAVSICRCSRGTTVRVRAVPFGECLGAHNEGQRCGAC